MSNNHRRIFEPEEISRHKVRKGDLPVTALALLLALGEPPADEPVKTGYIAPLGSISVHAALTANGSMSSGHGPSIEVAILAFGEERQQQVHEVDFSPHKLLRVRAYRRTSLQHPYCGF